MRNRRQLQMCDSISDPYARGPRFPLTSDVQGLFAGLCSETESDVSPRWIWSRRGRLSAVPQAAPRWVWGVLCSAGRGRSTFPQGGTSHLAIMPAAGFPSYTRIFSPPPPPSLSFSTLNTLNYFPPSLCDTLVLAISPHNFPREVSQPNPAHQMFRIDISD